ncbi:MAG: DUF6456 domain-containing protein [Rubrimonas sp.]|uniref:DUF6456 domain-containing protein n=1 Tax=Rubrimonas sp. TaxID=2036015 RepID=UPI002FDCC50E
MHTAATTFARCAATAEAVLAHAPKRRSTDASLYLAHVEGAAPLRRLSDVTGKPVSSVHRAVRRIEALRDDPLLDAAFDALGDAARAALSLKSPEESPVPAPAPSRCPTLSPAAHRVNRVALRALEKLCEPESFLMVAKGAEKAGVFCRKNRFRRPLALVTLEAAVDFAAQDWVRCASRTEMSAKYVLSPVGRAWVKRKQAEAEAEEADGRPTPFAAQHAARGERLVARADGGVEAIRVNVAESPLGWLARRKGADGAAFLEPEEVEAGERLREDFETAQIGPRVTQDWRNFLTPRERPTGSRGPCEGPAAARERVARALAELGPGLSDAALRACCFLEGLEATERRMGWSARSGKVVLKLALQRLALHYGLTRPQPLRADA